MGCLDVWNAENQFTEEGEGNTQPEEDCIFKGAKEKCSESNNAKDIDHKKGKKNRKNKKRY